MLADTIKMTAMVIKAFFEISYSVLVLAAILVRSFECENLAYAFLDLTPQMMMVKYTDFQVDRKDSINRKGNRQKSWHTTEVRGCTEQSLPSPSAIS